MTKIELEEIEKLDEVETIDESDETIDWKEKTKSLVEKAIQRREKSKIFRQQYKDTMDELTKLKANPPNTPPLKKEENKPEDNTLLKKAFLRSAGITDSEEVELALSTAKKWSVEVDALVDDDDFKAKLEKHRTAKANTLATSNIRGGAGTSKAKDSIEYWLNLGRTPKADEVSDIKFRAKVLRAFADKEKGVGQGHFYNS